MNQKGFNEASRKGLCAKCGYSEKRAITSAGKLKRYLYCVHHDSWCLIVSRNCFMNSQNIKWKNAGRTPFLGNKE